MLYSVRIFIDKSLLPRYGQDSKWYITHTQNLFFTNSKGFVWLLLAKPVWSSTYYVLEHICIETNNQRPYFHGAGVVREVINHVNCSFICSIKLLKDLTFATKIMNCIIWESEFDGFIKFVHLEPWFKVSVFWGDYGGNGWHLLLMQFSWQLNLKEPDVVENSFGHTDISPPTASVKACFSCRVFLAYTTPYHSAGGE